MGKLGKETKNLLLAITVICLISFLLAAGLSFLLAKDFQHEMLLHDYGVSGYQLNHEDKLQISAFTAHPNESDIERGKEALASIGYSESNIYAAIANCSGISKSDDAVSILAAVVSVRYGISGSAVLSATPA